MISGVFEMFFPQKMLERALLFLRFFEKKTFQILASDPVEYLNIKRLGYISWVV
jgi:hypothetical protein